jgi:flavin reductase (DIM6/NTAB) family NADH-FMN oxidoreductase RutF
METRNELNFWDEANEMLARLRDEGVLCTVIDKTGRINVITLGWGLIGPSYHGHPVLAIAIAPQRFSWRFLEEIPEFTIAVPDDPIRKSVDICGTLSGRNADKFMAAGLTPVPGHFVQTPSILECPVNIECRVYTKVTPPHNLLTPEHRKAPLDHQHTIYFSEVLGTFRR